jgi:lysozyme
MANEALKTSKNGLNLIKKFEGLRLDAYLDAVQIPTIGYGTIVYPNGVRVKLGDKCTEAQAEQYLTFKLNQFEADIKRMVKVSLKAQQFDALVSFVYNLGPTNFSKSTLLKKINLKEFDSAAEEFLKWNKAGGKVLKGLTRRREAEKELFESDGNENKFLEYLDSVL